MKLTDIFCEVYDRDESTQVGIINAIIAGSIVRSEIPNGIGTLAFNVDVSDLPSSFGEGMCLWFPNLTWKYYVDTIEWKEDNKVRVTANDETVKLTWGTVGFAAKYKMDVLQLMSYLVEAGIAKVTPGATVSSDITASYGHPGYFIRELQAKVQETTVAFEGETFLDAINAVAKFYGAYFVLQKHGPPRMFTANKFPVWKFGYFRDTPYEPTLYTSSNYRDSYAGIYLANSVLFDVYPDNSHGAKIMLRPSTYKNRWSATCPTFGLSTLSFYRGEDPYGFGLVLAGNKEYVSPLDINNQQTLNVRKVIQTSTGGKLINRVFMLGGGMFSYRDAAGALVRDVNGKVVEAPLNLGRAKGRTDPYPVTYDSATKNWYMQDNDSPLFPQVREKIIRYNEIVPLSASEADMNFAANALYDIGAYFLNKFSKPLETYTLTLLGTLTQLKVGAVMRLTWNSWVSAPNKNDIVKKIDKYFYITRIDWTYDNAGLEVPTAYISENGQEEMEFTDVMVDAFAQVKKLNMRITPNITYNSWPSPTQILTKDTPFKFSFYIDDSVYSINELFADIYVQRLRKIEWKAEPAGAMTDNTTALSKHVISNMKAVFKPDWKWPHRHKIGVFGYNGAIEANTIATANRYFFQHITQPAPTAKIMGVTYIPDTIFPNGQPLTNQSRLTMLDSYNSTYQYKDFFIMTESDIDYGIFYDALGNPTETKAPDVPLDIVLEDQKLTLPDHDTPLIYSVADEAVENKAATITAKIGNLAITLVLDTAASTSLMDVYRPDLTTLITGLDFKKKWHTIEINCLSGNAEVFVNVRGRMTILPISA